MRKRHINLLLCDFAYIMTFQCFQGEHSGFISKAGILGGLRRRVEVRGYSRYQEQGETRKRAKTRMGVKAHDRAPTHQARPAGQQYGTGWPCHLARPCQVGRPQVLLFRNFFCSGHLSFRVFFLCFSSGFRVLERCLRESSNFRLALNSCFWIANCEDLTIVLPSIINLFKFVFILSSLGLLFLGFLCVLQWLLI